MKRIMINNGSVTREAALEEARRYHKETGKAVEVSNTFGDPVLWIDNKGKEHTYGY